MRTRRRPIASKSNSRPSSAGAAPPLRRRPRAAFATPARPARPARSCLEFLLCMGRHPSRIFCVNETENPETSRVWHGSPAQKISESSNIFKGWHKWAVEPRMSDKHRRPSHPLYSMARASCRCRMPQVRGSSASCLLNDLPPGAPGKTGMGARRSGRRPPSKTELAHVDWFASDLQLAGIPIDHFLFLSFCDAADDDRPRRLMPGVREQPGTCDQLGTGSHHVIKKHDGMLGLVYQNHLFLKQIWVSGAGALVLRHPGGPPTNERFDHGAAAESVGDVLGQFVGPAGGDQWDDRVAVRDRDNGNLAVLADGRPQLPPYRADERLHEGLHVALIEAARFLPGGYDTIEMAVDRLALHRFHDLHRGVVHVSPIDAFNFCQIPARPRNRYCTHAISWMVFRMSEVVSRTATFCLPTKRGGHVRLVSSTTD